MPRRMWGHGAIGDVVGRVSSVLFGTDTNLDLAQVLFDLGGVQFGSFDLTGAAGTSPLYINPRVLISEPAMLRRIARLIHAEIRADRSRRRPRISTFAAVAGVPMGGLHVATAYALESDTPLIYLRPSTGVMDDDNLEVEGRIVPGQSALIVDDLMTGGTSILTTAKQLERVEMRVRNAIVLIDREQNGIERLHDHGLHVTPILRLKTMLNYYHANRMIDEATFQRCLAYLADKDSERSSNNHNSDELPPQQ
jgi:orotate phosphoribosyltransferase/uridine monophosphate synthetase